MPKEKADLQKLAHLKLLRFSEYPEIGLFVIPDGPRAIAKLRYSVQLPTDLRFAKVPHCNVALLHSIYNPYYSNPLYIDTHLRNIIRMLNVLVKHQNNSNIDLNTLIESIPFADTDETKVALAGFRAKNGITLATAMLPQSFKDKLKGHSVERPLSALELDIDAAVIASSSPTPLSHLQPNSVPFCAEVPSDPIDTVFVEGKPDGINPLGFFEGLGLFSPPTLSTPDHSFSEKDNVTVNSFLNDEWFSNKKQKIS